MDTNILIPTEIRGPEDTDDDDDDGDPKPVQDVVDVPIPIITSSSRNQDNAHKIYTDQVTEVMQRPGTGPDALKKLYIVRHGALSIKSNMSHASAENKFSTEQQFKKFEQGFRSMPDIKSKATNNDLSNEELLGALFREPSQGAATSSIRDCETIKRIDVRTRMNEEEYLREPFYEGERQCKMGMMCQGLFVTSVDGFILVEYDSLRLAAHRKDHQDESCETCETQMCVLCWRRLIQRQWTRNAARNSAYNHTSIPEVLPAFRNIIGPGEYDATDTYHCRQTSIEMTIYPVVAYSNTSFRLGHRRMPNGKIVKEYKQVLIKPEYPGFQDGRT